MRPSSDVSAYLRRVGLPHDPHPVVPPAFVEEVRAAAEGALETPPSEEALVALFRYRVPKPGPDGACSLLDELEEEPFDLRTGTALEGLPPAALRTHPEAIRLVRLAGLAAALHRQTGADWTGLYRRAERREGGEALRKEAYRGRPSRALFPLDEAYFARSNNSRAAMTGRAILVEDVAAHVRSGQAYYECDPDVRSELCVPVMGGDRAVGLIDLESFRTGAFDAKARAATALVALVLVDARLFA